MAFATTSSDDLLAMAWKRASRSGVVFVAASDKADGAATTLAEAMEGLVR